MFCKYYQEEVCVNADCEMAADFPSEEYCESCIHRIELTPLENLQRLFDNYAACNMRLMARSYIDDNGDVSFPEDICKETEKWKEKFEEAFIEYHAGNGHQNV